MKRIIVIGCPGSGKSTFSRALHEATNIALHHLDMMNWNFDKTTVPKDLFLERLKETIKKESWIIDGNYGSTIEIRMQACDTIFFLDYSLDVCLHGIMSRTGKERTDMPWIEVNDDVDEEFIQFVKNFNSHSKPQIMDLLEKYNDRSIYVLNSRKEADVFLSLL